MCLGTYLSFLRVDLLFAYTLLMRLPMAHRLKNLESQDCPLLLQKEKKIEV